MTAEPSPGVRFRRALKTGDPLLILVSYDELPTPQLADKLGVTLALRRDPRYDRAVVGFLIAYLDKHRDTDLHRLATMLDYFARFAAGNLDSARDLAALLENTGDRECARIATDVAA